MKKNTFSSSRIIAFVAIGILGIILSLSLIFYFLDKNPNFTYLQLACALVGTIALSSSMQYVLINIVKKYIPID